MNPYCYVLYVGYVSKTQQTNPNPAHSLTKPTNQSFIGETALSAISQPTEHASLQPLTLNLTNHKDQDTIKLPRRSKPTPHTKKNK
jgi:hypothetical protein